MVSKEVIHLIKTLLSPKIWHWIWNRPTPPIRNSESDLCIFRTGTASSHTSYVPIICLTEVLLFSNILVEGYLISKIALAHDPL